MGEIALKSPASRLFTQSFIQTQIKENIKAPRHWPLCGEFTGDRWILGTNGQLHGKCFHLMTSSCNSDFSSDTGPHCLAIAHQWCFHILFTIISSKCEPLCTYGRTLIRVRWPRTHWPADILMASFKKIILMGQRWGISSAMCTI